MSQDSISSGDDVHLQPTFLHWGHILCVRSHFIFTPSPIYLPFIHDMITSTDERLSWSIILISCNVSTWMKPSPLPLLLPEVGRVYYGMKEWWILSSNIFSTHWPLSCNQGRHCVWDPIWYSVHHPSIHHLFMETGETRSHPLMKDCRGRLSRSLATSLHGCRPRRLHYFCLK